jgi:phosphoribosylformimino-5-aminoimidazole carboxamide ribotide isomerase
MELIPVVDLLRGAVVRARQGDRATYRPIESTLCAGSDPATVARALVAHCAAPALYVADLDALQGGAPQAAVLGALLAALPATELWLDAGFADAAAAQALRAALGAAGGRVVPVFASEALASRAALAEACAHRADVLLSLDRRAGRRLDRAGCWDAPALWPARVIVMTLERVGSAAGPDLATVAALRARSPATRWIGAGGVRDAADLEAAATTGAEAWLVASALHDGAIAARR